MNVNMAKGLSLVIVVAVADNGVIGAKGDLPLEYLSGFEKSERVDHWKTIADGTEDLRLYWAPTSWKKKYCIDKRS